jgi:hypothetical protein
MSKPWAFNSRACWDIIALGEVLIRVILSEKLGGIIFNSY